jgi:hypothetical protein
MNIERCFEILGVAPGASKEQIRAAYLTRVAQYHPDKVAALGPELRLLAEQMTKQINGAYRVLQSFQASGAAQPVSPRPSPPVPPRPPPRTPSEPTPRPSGPSLIQLLLGLVRPWLPLAFSGLVVWSCFQYLDSIPSTPPRPRLPVVTPPPVERELVAPDPLESLERAPARPAYVRPATAPNGAPWPAQSGYVARAQRLNTNGLSAITIDNRQNDADVFVKLIHHKSEHERIAVRLFLIRAHDRFRISSVRQGKYDIRYRDLDSGVISKSDPFLLEERAVAGGTEYSDLTLTLYLVRDGNMHMEVISEAEF